GDALQAIAQILAQLAARLGGHKQAEAGADEQAHREDADGPADDGGGGALGLQPHHFQDVVLVHIAQFAQLHGSSPLVRVRLLACPLPAASPLTLPSSSSIDSTTSAPPCLSSGTTARRIPFGSPS